LLQRDRLWLNQPRETIGNFPRIMNRAEMLHRLRDAPPVWDVLVIGVASSPWLDFIGA
jgi:hypothetical protein